MNQTTLPKPLQALDAVMQHRIILTEDTAVTHPAFDQTFSHVTIESAAGHTRISLTKPTKENVPLFIVFAAETKPLEHHLSIDLGPGTTLALIECVYGTHQHAINLQVTLNVAIDASLRYTTLSDVAVDTPLSIMRRAHLASRANLLATHAAFASALTHQEQHIYLDGPYAEATAKVIALTDGTQEALFKTVIEHHAPDTFGRIEHYGVANDASTLLFEGASIIHKGMKRSRAKQSNKGLVIGEKARLDANPLLLIDEYDVEAGHGAAIGRIDDQQLYYLMSRGLTRKTAERLIIHGYLAPLKAVIAAEALNQHIESLLESKTK